MSVTWDDKAAGGVATVPAPVPVQVKSDRSPEVAGSMGSPVIAQPLPTSSSSSSLASPPTSASASASAALRHRSVSNVSTASTVASTNDSIASTTTSVPYKRQRDFESLFGPQLRPRRLTDRPLDFLTVLQTQSADLQASVLLHGRLYLTSYHLCFRSNIVGYITEKIYPLGDILKVERSTTAKWIQNAVSLTVVLESGEEEVVGYGSMGDREAMYEALLDAWKARAPERYGSFMESKKKDEERKRAIAVIAEEEERKVSSSTLRPSDTEVDKGETATKEATQTKTNGSASTTPANAVGTTTRDRSASEVKHTQPSGEKYDQEALDTKIPIPMDQLFNLMYHNKEFHMDFLKVKQKLTDVDVSEWSVVGGKKERKMTYVMHMNNRIGPKKSDCNGLERIEVEDPEKAYEIVSETQTPDIPSGKSFKIRTRTCLSHTGANNDETAATRLYCTTQCDWSASSMLKSTITPAVIKGQKEYHQKLLSAITEWISTHPDDFETASSPNGDVATEEPSGATEKGERSPDLMTVKSQMKPIEPTSGEGDTRSILLQLGDIFSNQAFMWMTVVCLMSMGLNLYFITSKLF